MARVPRPLPPGTLRRLRLKWFALGVLLGTKKSPSWTAAAH